MSENFKFKWFSKKVVIPAAVIMAASVWGSISAGKISEEQMMNLSAYLNGFFKDVPGADKAILFNALKKQGIMWSLITFSGWLLPMCLVNLAVIWERGFVVGYTTAGFCRIYGLKGISACAALLPEMLLFIPVLAFFSSISLKMSFFSYENKKKFLKKYLLIALFFLSVFCVVSLIQTFLTTIFMQWISRTM